MIPRPVVVSLFALVFASNPPAQKGVESLHAKIAELTAQNQELKEQNRMLKKMLGQRNKPPVAKKAPQVVKKRAAEDAAKLALEAKKIEAGVARIQAALVRNRARAKRRVFFRGLSPTTNPNPLLQGEYQKALAEFQKVHQRLQSTKDVDAAMKAVDEASQILLRARGALWKQKQAAKEAKPDK